MAGFILRRLLWTIPILWVVLTIEFFICLNLLVDIAHHLLDARLREA
jgi:ABC-type microcin C transport system permease subunit YejB